MTKKKKIILAVAVIAVAAAGLKVALGAGGQEPIGTPVTTAAVTRQDLQEVLKENASPTASKQPPSGFATARWEHPK